MPSGRVVRWLVVASLLAVAACAEVSSGFGRDDVSKTDASQVTWTDGKSAVSIACAAPGSCQQRAMAICKQKPYTVLSSQNMPSTGNEDKAQHNAKVVVRCS